MSTVCFLQNINSPVEITAVSGGGSDIYQTVMEVPAGRFVTGHDYVIVGHGVWGSGSQLGFSSIQEVVPFLGAWPFGTYLTNQAVKRAFSQTGDRSMPFFWIYRNLSWPASTPFQVIGTRRNVTGAGNFYVGNVTLHVWDLSNLATEGVSYLVSGSAGSTTFPGPGQTPGIGSSAAGATGFNQLCYHFLSCIPRVGGGIGGPRHWLELGSLSPYGQDALVAPAAGAGAEQYSNGSYIMFDSIGVATLQTRYIDDFVGTQSTFIASSIFQVSLPASMFPLRTTDSAQRFWSQVMPWDGDEQLLQVSPSYYYANNILARVNGIAGLNATLLECEGVPVGGNVINSPVSLVETVVNRRVNQHKAGEHQHGGGPHYISWRGGSSVNTAARFPPAAPINGIDSQIIAFNGIIGGIPATPILEEAGGIVPIIPQRETTISLASLPLLPFDPQSGHPVSTDMQERVHQAGGYRISSPRWSKALQEVELIWSLNAGDAATCHAFLTNLKNTNGAFRYQPPWEATMRAYSVMSAEYEDEHTLSRGIRVLHAKALRLIWVTP